MVAATRGWELLQHNIDFGAELHTLNPNSGRLKRQRRWSFWVATTWRQRKDVSSFRSGRLMIVEQLALATQNDLTHQFSIVYLVSS